VALPDSQLPIPERRRLLQKLTAQILSLPAEDVLRIGVDGVDGAGKSMFGDELASLLAEAGRHVIRASVDSFHQPKALRYQRGRHSPDGFFHNSYDYRQLRAVLLDPLSPGGNGRYRAAVFDHRTDTPVSVPEAQAAPGDILVFDGIFLHRPELRSYWDWSVFLHISTAVSVRRCALRDGSPDDPQAVENRRYIEGQRLYLEECAPRHHATIVVNNEVLERPVVEV
jgi:uridine kinase